MCRAHATVRGLIGEMVAQSGDERDIVVDMEAGLEHLSRGTGKHVSSFLVVIEPYYRSMETARRIAELARELGVGRVHGVANKVRDGEDSMALRRFCDEHGIEVIAEVPFDESVLGAERAAVPPIVFAPDAPAVRALSALGSSLLSS